MLRVACCQHRLTINYRQYKSTLLPTRNKVYTISLMELKSVSATSVELEIEAIGPALSRLRKARDLTQDEAVALARSSGVQITISTLSNWESSRRPPTFSTMWGYLRSLDCSWHDLATAHESETARLVAARKRAGEELSLPEVLELVRKRAETDPDLRDEIAKLNRELHQAKEPGRG